MKREDGVSLKEINIPRVLKAVFFDYDGVVADTMEDNYEAWRFAFGQHGVEIGREEYFLLEGMSPKSIAERLGGDHGLSESSFDRLTDLKAEYYRFHNKFRLYPNIQELLIQLKEKGIKLALISGAKRHRIIEMTPVDFLALFDLIVTADDVVRPKPNPESYLLGLKSLAVASDEVIVIENAPLGIQSGKAAGIYCLALCTTLAKSYLKEADLVLNDMQDVSELFNIHLK